MIMVSTAEPIEADASEVGRDIGKSFEKVENRIGFVEGFRFLLESKE